MRVSSDVLAVLHRATCEGNALSLLSVGQLDRKLYADTNKALEAAGGKWNRKAKAHVFDGDAAAAIEPIILTGEIVSVKQELQQFYTPPELARRVVEVAGIEPDHFVLEPSAGRGALAAEALLAGGHVHCVEIDARNVEILCSTPYSGVVKGDFLAQDPTPSFERVVMNPPFTKGQDVQHVDHALRFVRPGGRLVAIMSGGITFNTIGPAARFRETVARMGGLIEMLPEGAFKASGTSVLACLVIIDKAGAR